MIKELSDIKSKINYLPKDKNNREINIYQLNNCSLAGDSCFYPNTLLLCSDTKELYNPIKEKIMSLDKQTGETKVEKTNYTIKKVINHPVFFFIYNTDNYFHFVYDTLPYLITYKFLKAKISNLKLLMNYPNPEKKCFYNFVKEFLQILNISNKDIIIANHNTLYKKIYISNSYTHDFNSNLPPREEIYQFYNEIIKKVKEKYKLKEPIPKIYISRRTWLHNNFSNIGTNYTTRRKLVNEDQLVNYLTKKGYKEIFTENLSTIEKILIFSNAESIVGAIGGGVVNALFAKPKTKLFVLVSPTFLEKHKRFKYCFKNKKTKYFTHSVHAEKTIWKKYMRVKNIKNNIVGEIEKVNKNSLKILYVDYNVAGWNSEIIFKKAIFPKKDCIKLDNGLNCAWKINLNKLSKLI